MIEYRQSKETLWKLLAGVTKIGWVIDAKDRDIQTSRDGLKALDKTSLSRIFKIWCLQYGIYPRPQWPLMIYDLASRVERIETMQCLHWEMFKTAKENINNTAIYRQKLQLYQFHWFLKSIKLGKPEQFWCSGILRMRRHAKALPME